MDDEDVAEVFEEITAAMDHDHLAEVARQARRIRVVWLLRHVALGTLYAAVTVSAIACTIAIVVGATVAVLQLVHYGW